MPHDTGLASFQKNHELLSGQAVSRIDFLVNLTGQVAASRLHTYQARFAKMEAGDASVSLDLMFRSLFSLGVSRKDLLTAIQ